MSKLPLAPIFSAAHVSKWDTLHEDIRHIRTTQSNIERTGPLFPPDQGNGHDTDSDDQGRPELDPLNPDGSMEFSRRECEITVRVAASVGGTVTRTRSAYPTRSRESMAVKTYNWITLWFLLTAPVIVWDVTYCFMRPRSMVGGDLHWIWWPYAIYQNVDHLYGVKALEENNGFTNAQSLLNLVETVMNLAYVYFAHVSNWSGAPLIGFAAVAMTLSKTVLFGLQEYFCGGCSTGHNAWGDFLLFWILPNGLWLLFPSMIVWRLGGDILSSLSVASQSTRKAASGKMP